MTCMVEFCDKLLFFNPTGGHSHVPVNDYQYEYSRLDFSLMTDAKEEENRRHIATSYFSQLSAGESIMMISQGKLPLFLPLVLSGLWLCAGQSGPCARKNMFKSDVLVLLDGKEFDKVENDKDELHYMGLAFSDAWDKANHPSANSWCDKTYFKHVRNIDIKPEGNYLVHGAQADRDARKAFVYSVTGGCNNNCPDYKLFHGRGKPSTRRDRDLSSFVNDPGTYTRCSCNSGRDNRSPTELEFLDFFEIEIQRQIKRGKLKYIKKVYDIIEYEPFWCSDQVDKYDEDVEIHLKQKVAPGDEPALTQGYVDAYNTLAKYFCDLSYTHIVDAEMMAASYTELGHPTLRRRLKKRLLRTTKKRKKKKESGTTNDGTRRLATSYHVVIIYPGGYRKKATLDEAGFKTLRASTRLRYRLISTSKTQEDPTVSAQTTEKTAPDIKPVEAPAPSPSEPEYTYSLSCFCPKRPYANRAPNETEIAVAYEEMLKFESDQGQVAVEYDVKSVETTCTSCD